MIELPEALVIAKQFNGAVEGKMITNVTAAHTPHKFAWYYKDPNSYHSLLSGKVIGKAAGYGSMVEITAEDSVILFGEGVGLRFHGAGEERPSRHQLLIEFEDESAISATIQMYGGLWCFREGEFDNKYYVCAKEKTPPLSDEFDREYFNGLIAAPEVQKLSAKALLATEQRIPGLGNGVLQDILFNAGIHPKKKVNTFLDPDRELLFESVKSTLAEMTFKEGRDSERDLFGCKGGYAVIAGKNTADQPCPRCGGIIKKENYMGGSIYFCGGCQKM